MNGGWRAVFRGPGLALAEIAWRWSFAIAAWVLIALTAREYLASIRFSSGDWTLIRTRQPVLIAEAIAHALQGSGPRLLQAAIIVALGLVVLWIFAASVGRAATLKALLPRSMAAGVGSLVGLNFLRSAVTLAAIVGYVGILVIAGFVAPVDATDTNALLAAVLLFLALAVVVGFFWSVVNWFLSVAAIFVVQNDRDTWGAIADSVAFFRRRPGALTGVTLLFDAVKLVLIVIATLAVVGVFSGVKGSATMKTALWIAGGITLLYCAAADVLCIARLAVYVRMAGQELETPDRELVASS